MKQFFTPALALLILVSCQKPSTVIQTPPLDPAKQYTINYDMNDQVVKTSVGHDTLFLDYYESVNFLVDPVEYKYSWALGLQQDFSKSSLANLHFSALAENGNYAYDWVTQNFNNLHETQKVVVDTTVNGKKYTKVKLSRVFYFLSFLESPQAAIDKQNALWQNKTDAVSFSSYYFYNGITSLPNKATATITYVKK